MDFKSVFILLNDHFKEANVNFAVIGGFALASAGYSRATTDIDMLVDKNDMLKVKRIMSDLGYDPAFESDEVTCFLSKLDKLGRVDFLHAHRKYAKAMLERAKEDKALKLKVIIPEDLIGLKVQSSSNDPDRYHQDMADIEEVLRVNIDKLDLVLVKEYFDLFGRGDELDIILKRIRNA